MSESAAAKRAERRRQRILNNSEDRMKKIFGGQNYHEEHLKLATTPNEEEDANDIIPVQSFNNQVTRNDPMDENILSGENIFSQLTQPKKEEKKLSTQNPALSWTFWTLLGALMRFLITNPVISGILYENVLTPFLVTFMTVCFISDGMALQTSSVLIDIIGLFAGLDSVKITRLKTILSIIINLWYFFISYFAGFLAIDIILALI